jgi:hypothetical protein
MAYRLKTVRYQNSDCKILLQNENGPCPLLAAANALLLKKSISLPSECVRSGVASIDDVVNILAEKALLSSSKVGAEVHLDELLNIIPKLQFGMDVNPKFTQGVTGVEYTTNLTAFDLLHVDLVHGWLLDPQDTYTTSLVGNKTYNELVEVVVHGNEAASQVEVLTKRIEELELEIAALDVDNTNSNKEETKEQEEEWVNVDRDENETKETSTLPTVDTPATSSNNELDASAVLVNDDKNTSSVDDKDNETDESPPKPDDADTTKSSDIAKDPVADVPPLVQDVYVVSNGEETVEIVPTSNANQETIKEPTEEPSTKQDEKAELPQSLLERKEKLQQELLELKEKQHELSTVATNGSLINTFLSSTGHQLTHYGLHELYEYLQEESLCVFFRNNHFGTLTKHGGVLYLLVTDLGYANVPQVMWEKLDGIDGDTEYVNAAFQKPAPQEKLAPAPGPSLNPEDVLAQRGQVDADMQLALELSRHDNTRNVDEEEGKLVAAATEASLRTFNGVDDKDANANTVESGTVAVIPPVSNPHGILDGCSTQEDSDKLIAMQIQAQLDNEDASERLARQLQAQENRQRPQTAASRGSNGRRKASANSSSSKESCVIC